MSREHQEPEMLLGFMDSMKRAASYANGMAHAQQNPQWLAVRDLLEGCRGQAVKMATQKAVPRHQVLGMLDHRSKMAGTS